MGGFGFGGSTASFPARAAHNRLTRTLRTRFSGHSGAAAAAGPTSARLAGSSPVADSDETRVLFLFPEAGASFSFAASSE